MATISILNLHESRISLGPQDGRSQSPLQTLADESYFENNLERLNYESNIEKQEINKQKHQKILDFKRQQSSNYLKRWDEYRDTKLTLVRNFLRVLKSQSRMKMWISIVQMQKNTKMICTNAQQRIDDMNRKFASYMMSIMFKTRFYMRYSKRLGGDVMFREKNRLRQSITFLTGFIEVQANETSSNLIYEFLHERKTVVTLIEKMGVLQSKLLSINRVCRERIVASENRFLLLMELTQQELQNLKFIYQKVAKDKSRKKAGTKFLKILQEFDSESEPLQNALRLYQKKLRTDHMLYYCICYYCRVLKEIKELEGSKDQ